MTDYEAMPVCDDCGRLRNGDDIDYSPMQVLMGQPVGWYSGNDGELCPQCMARMVGLANGEKP